MKRLLLILALGVLPCSVSLADDVTGACTWSWAASGGDGQQVFVNGVPVSQGNNTITVPADVIARAQFSSGQDPGDNKVTFLFWRCGPNYASATHQFKIEITGPQWNSKPAPWSLDKEKAVGLQCGSCCEHKGCDLDCDGTDNGDDSDDDDDGILDCDDDDGDGDGIPDNSDVNPGACDETSVWHTGPPGGGPPDIWDDDTECHCCGAGLQNGCGDPCGGATDDDFDGDGTPNSEDDDDDGDGIPDCEDPDDDNDGTDDGPDDDDDNDSVPDDQDDNPGGCDCGNDFDCDGVGNNADDDDDNDGIDDGDDPDDDNDGINDDQDPDDDNDGIPDDEDDTPGGDGGGNGPCNPPPANDHDCDALENQCDADFANCVDENLNGKCDTCDEEEPCEPPGNVNDHDCDGVPNGCDRDYGPCLDANGNRICDQCEGDEECEDPPADDHDCDGVLNPCDSDYASCDDDDGNGVCDECELGGPPGGFPEIAQPDLGLPELNPDDLPSEAFGSGIFERSLIVPKPGGGDIVWKFGSSPFSWHQGTSALDGLGDVRSAMDALRVLVRGLLAFFVAYKFITAVLKLFWEF